MKTMDDLPDEILLIIFSKLNLRNISKAGGTCRKWRCLSMDVKTIQCIAKREFDYQEWMKQDFCPQKENLCYAKILGRFLLNGMIGWN